MSDFTTLNIQYNTGTDASPVWTGTAIAFGGSGGANELRFAPSSGPPNGSSTSSSAWPFVTRPASGTAAVPQLWAFPTDASGGSQITTYDGTNAKANVFRINWDNLGTYASAPIWTAFGDSTLPTPVPGSQVSTHSGDPVINGSSDTGNTSYLKGNMYGYGVDTGGTQQTPSAGAAGTTLSVTSGTAGAVNPATGAWLATWQSLQGLTQYIQNAVTPKALTAGFWYGSLVLYTGVNMLTGTMLFVFNLQYSYA